MKVKQLGRIEITVESQDGIKLDQAKRKWEEVGKIINFFLIKAIGEFHSSFLK